MGTTLYIAEHRREKGAHLETAIGTDGRGRPTVALALAARNTSISEVRHDASPGALDPQGNL